MDYKKLMGYGDKKKIIKKESKPKVNEVLESIKEEFGYKNDLKEVGAAPLYKKHFKKIDKSKEKFANDILNFYELLRKKGLDDEATDLLNTYKKFLVKFSLEFKKFFRKLL